MNWIRVEVAGVISEENKSNIILNEMPDEGQKILVTTRSGDVLTDECTYRNRNWTTKRGLGWFFDIIAWMPMPEPYDYKRD